MARRLAPRAALLTLAGFALVAGLGAQEAASRSDPCASAEHRQFDFWVGEWTVRQPDGTQAGTNRVEKILGGCVIQENWIGESGSRGRSFNQYSAVDGKWRQTWVDNAGQRLDLEGGLDDAGRMVFRGTLPGRDGAPVLHDLRFTPRDDGTVEQHWRASRDGGESWQDLFRGIYSRR